MKPMPVREGRNVRSRLKAGGRRGEIHTEVLASKLESADHTPILDDVAATKLAKVSKGEKDRTERAIRTIRVQTTEDDLHQRLMGVARAPGYTSITAYDMRPIEGTDELRETNRRGEVGLGHRDGDTTRSGQGASLSSLILYESNLFLYLTTDAIPCRRASLQVIMPFRLSSNRASASSPVAVLAAPGHLGRPQRTGTAHAEMHIRRRKGACYTAEEKVIRAPSSSARQGEESDGLRLHD